MSDSQVKSISDAALALARRALVRASAWKAARELPEADLIPGSPGQQALQLHANRAYDGLRDLAALKSSQGLDAIEWAEFSRHHPEIADAVDRLLACAVRGWHVARTCDDRKGGLNWSAGTTSPEWRWLDEIVEAIAAIGGADGERPDSGYLGLSIDEGQRTVGRVGFTPKIRLTQDFSRYSRYCSSLDTTIVLIQELRRRGGTVPMTSRNRLLEINRLTILKNCFWI